jgi:hypothetical protein
MHTIDTSMSCIVLIIELMTLAIVTAYICIMNALALYNYKCDYHNIILCIIDFTLSIFITTIIIPVIILHPT